MVAAGGWLGPDLLGVAADPKLTSAMALTALLPHAGRGDKVVPARRVAVSLIQRAGTQGIVHARRLQA